MKTVSQYQVIEISYLQNKIKYFLDPEFIPVRKFSRFNDSMKINKRRMSREEKHENITTPTTTSNSQTWWWLCRQLQLYMFLSRLIYLYRYSLGF